MDDLISRKEAIEAFDPENPRDWYTPWIIETLEELPAAQPEACAYWDEESNFCALHRPSAQPGEWLENYVSAILQAGSEGREVSFKVGDRTFAVRELNDER